MYAGLSLTRLINRVPAVKLEGVGNCGVRRVIAVGQFPVPEDWHRLTCSPGADDVNRTGSNFDCVRKIRQSSTAGHAEFPTIFCVTHCWGTPRMNTLPKMAVFVHP